MMLMDDKEKAPWNGVYYFSVKDKDGAESPPLIFELILPPYALDGNVRRGDYYVRYQPSSGLVLDVFYALPSSPDDRFSGGLDSISYLTICGMACEFSLRPFCNGCGSGSGAAQHSACVRALGRGWPARPQRRITKALQPVV